METEADVERAWVRAVNRRRGVSIKLNLRGRRGWPDRLNLFFPRLVLFAELKRRGKKPTKQQLIVHRLLRKLGFDVVAPDTKEQCQEIVDEFLERRRAK